MVVTTVELRRILHVEDNPGDVLMTQEAFASAGIRARLRIATTGEEAMAFLRQHGPAERPDLVILDLNLPVRSGQEVLSDMAGDPELRSIVVAILTSSPNDADVCARYERRLCRYFQKSPTFEGLVEIVKGISRFWLEASNRS